MPPPPAGRPGAGGGRAGRDRSPRPGPWGRGLCLLPNRFAQSMVVVLPPFLRVWGMSATLVPSIPLIWIGMTPSGLFFASFGRNWQV